MWQLAVPAVPSPACSVTVVSCKVRVARATGGPLPWLVRTTRFRLAWLLRWGTHYLLQQLRQCTFTQAPPRHWSCLQAIHLHRRNDPRGSLTSSEAQILCPPRYCTRSLWKGKLSRQCSAALSPSPPFILCDVSSWMCFFC